MFIISIPSHHPCRFSRIHFLRPAPFSRKEYCVCNSLSPSPLVLPPLACLGTCFPVNSPSSLFRIPITSVPSPTFSIRGGKGAHNRSIYAGDEFALRPDIPSRLCFHNKLPAERVPYKQGLSTALDKCYFIQIQTPARELPSVFRPFLDLGNQPLP